MIWRCRCALFVAAVILAGTRAPAAEPSVADLAKAASSGTPEKQIAAIDQLTDLGPRANSATPALIKALGSDDAGVRWHAARALAAIGAPAVEAVAKLTAALDDPDFHVRAQAAHALGKIGAGAKPATDALIARIVDEHASVRRQAIEALEVIAPGNEKVIKKLTEVLSTAEPPVAMAAIRTIAANGDKALPTAIDVLKTAEPKSKSRFWACVLLQEFGPKAKDAVAPLTKALEDPDPTIRMQAALALAAIGPDSAPAVPALTAGLSDKLEAVQYASAYALGMIGAKQALPELKKAAGSKDALVKLLATWAVAKTDPANEAATSQAVDEIVAAMESSRPEVRQAAARALWDLKAPHEKVGACAVQGAQRQRTGNRRPRDRQPGFAGRQDRAPRERRLARREAPRQGAGHRAADGSRSQSLRARAGQAARRRGRRPESLGAHGALGDWSRRRRSRRAGRQIAHVRFGSGAKRGRDCPGPHRFGRRVGGSGDRKAAQGQIAVRPGGRRLALSQIQKDHAALAKKVLPQVIELLRSPNELVRIEAADTLGALGPAAKGALPDLKKAVGDSSPIVSRSATVAIDRIEKKAIK